MLGAIESELAKLIARELFQYAKEASPEIAGNLKGTALTKSGKGFPESVLATYEKSFLKVISDYKSCRNGYANWRHKNTEVTFQFVFADGIISQINQNSDWAESANLTEEGVRQINAVGGPKKYQNFISRAIVNCFNPAIKQCVGKFYKPKFANEGWRVLSPVELRGIAKEGSNNFSSKQNIFYLSTGSDKLTKKEYRSAKKLISKSYFGLGSATEPSKGPYSYESVKWV